MTTSYIKGELVRVVGQFLNASGAFADPTTVTFKFKTPAGAITTYAYPTDAQLVKDAVGEYHVDIDANAVGPWSYRWSSAGSNQSAIEGGFTVPASEF